MKEISSIKEKKSPLKLIGLFFGKIGSSFEVVFIILIWFFIFSNSQTLGNFSMQDMIAYLLIGNLIGLFSSYLLYRILRYNIGAGDMKMFYYKPLAYIFRVFFRTLKKLIIPFLFSISLNILLLYFFVSNVYLNYETKYLFLILFMIILAFITELLIALALDMYVFWTFESNGLSKVISRLKKILAGAYFPLSFLGTNFLIISLLFPFAYSFYVPTQLYLKNISFEQGLLGIAVQLTWIVIIYFIIKISWKNKMEKIKMSLSERKTVL